MMAKLSLKRVSPNSSAGSLLLRLDSQQNSARNKSWASQKPPQLAWWQKGQDPAALPGTAPTVTEPIHHSPSPSFSQAT